MRAEAISALVIVDRLRIVIENPHMLRTPGLVHQTADLLVLAFPEAAYAAVLSMLPPERRIDVAFGVEGRGEFIGMARRTDRTFLGARR